MIKIVIGCDECSCEYERELAHYETTIDLKQEVTSGTFQDNGEYGVPWTFDGYVLCPRCAAGDDCSECAGGEEDPLVTAFVNNMVEAEMRRISGD